MPKAVPSRQRRAGWRSDIMGCHESGFSLTEPKNYKNWALRPSPAQLCGVVGNHLDGQALLISFFGP
eukprot:1359426-Amorphochlora_amoeboformis.AAC.3